MPASPDEPSWEDLSPQIEARLARYDPTKGTAQLSSLQLTDAHIGQVLDRLAQLKGLQRLVLDKNSIGPAGAAAITAAGMLKNLQQLSLSGNALGTQGVRTLMQSKALAGLISLNVAGNLTEDEKNTWIAYAVPLAGLVSLDISGNALGHEDAEVIAQSCKNLKRLHIGNNRIGASGAAAIAQHLRELISLSLGNNGVGDPGIAAIARSLNQLQTLYASYSGITQTGVSAIARRMKALKNLILSGNKISSPQAIIDLINALTQHGGALTNISVAYNPFMHQGVTLHVPDLGGLRPCSEVLASLNNAVASGTHTLPHARFIFIGAGGNGKSQLAGAISFQLEKGKPARESTVGVEVVRLPRRNSGRARNLQARIFDCGGQPEQYQIHRALWETCRTVIVLVVDACKPIGWVGEHAIEKDAYDKPLRVQGNRITYFLKMIEAEFKRRKSDPPPVAIVLTHGDKLADIDAKRSGTDRTAYPTIQSLQDCAKSFEGRLNVHVRSNPVDGLNQGGMRGLHFFLQKLAHRDCGVDAALPPAFSAVRRNIINQFGSFTYPNPHVWGMTRQEFDQLCHNCGVSGKTDDYLRTLASLGDLIQDPVDPDASEFVFNTHWAQKALYKLVTDKTVHAKRGVLTDDDLRKVLPGNDRDRVIKISHAIRLMFEVHGKPSDDGLRDKRWIVPQALGFQDHPHDWAKTNPATSTPAQTYLPETKFLAFLGENAEWIQRWNTEAFRDEAVFTMPDTEPAVKALVRPDYESEMMSVKFYADPADETDESKKWCRTLCERMKGLAAAVSSGQTAGTKKQLPKRNKIEAPKHIEHIRDVLKAKTVYFRNVTALAKQARCSRSFVYNVLQSDHRSHDAEIKKLWSTHAEDVLTEAILKKSQSGGKKHSQSRAGFVEARAVATTPDPGAEAAMKDSDKKQARLATTLREFSREALLEELLKLKISKYSVRDVTALFYDMYDDANGKRDKLIALMAEQCVRQQDEADRPAVFPPTTS